MRHHPGGHQRRFLDGPVKRRPRDGPGQAPQIAYDETVRKPILHIEIRTPDHLAETVRAVFDTGSFYTIVREDKAPSPASVVRRKSPRTLKAAARGSQLTAVGEVSLVLSIGDRQIPHCQHSPTLVA